jgi:two-component system NtrC family sensor kinase
VPAMTNLPTFISRSLAAKLIIALLSVVIIGVGISWYALIHTDRENLVAEAVKDAASYSDLMKKSIRHDMLAADRNAIQRTIDDLKSAQDVDGIRLFDKTGRIVYSSMHEEVGHRTERTSLACKGCHADGAMPSGSLAGTGQWVIDRGAEGYNVLTFVEPIYNEPACWQAACHIHPEAQRVLGVLKSDYSLAAVDKSIQAQARNTTLYAIVLMSAISVILYVVLRRFVLKPVSTLSQAMEQVAHGSLGRTVAAGSQDEVGLLVRSFNDMTQELKLSRDRMGEWTESLEREIAKKTIELKQSQNRLIQAEKLAALGRFTAAVAHELRNPLTVIGGFARRLRKSATGEQEKERAGIIVAEVGRLEKILRDVLLFSSVRDAQYQFERGCIEDVVRDVLALYEQACSEQSVTVAASIDMDRLPVLMDRDHVRRALINIISNAIESMPRGGSLTVTGRNEILHSIRYARITIADTGEGMDEHILSLIFEPFFTMRDAGRGTGLGLTITRKIIEEHGGFVRAESAQGKGSVFSLYLPQQSEEESRETPCWEYMRCGRNMDTATKCPAYPNFGRSCWAIAGTFCEGKVQGAFAQKCEDCRTCAFYQKVEKERK